MLNLQIVLEIFLEMRFCDVSEVPEKSVFTRLFCVFATTMLANCQDRLVVTASIFLRIYGVVHYTIYTQSYFEVARETRFTNPLRIPHEDASSSLVSSE